jgi:hypothetical protein
MTAVTGKAFEMRYTVKHLMRRHGIAPAPCVVPLTAPQLHPMTLDGFASTTDLDLDCCRFRRHAFTLLPWAPLVRLVSGFGCDYAPGHGSLFPLPPSQG